MAIEGFQYKEFAEEMARQAKELVPQEFNEHQKTYIIKTIENLTKMAGEALYNDTKLKFNAEQATLVSQIIAEWAYYKSIDLIHSRILPEYWDGIMQKIAYTIFEVAKQAILRNVPQDQMLEVIEQQVNRAYIAGLEALEKKKLISAEAKEFAAKQSTIDDMAKKVQAEQATAAKAAVQPSSQQDTQASTPNPAQKNASADSKVQVAGKSAKLLSLALFLKLLSQDKVVTILNKFSPEDTQTITQFMQTPDLESKIDPELTCRCLNEIREYLPKKPKLTEENLVKHLQRVFDNTSRDKVEQLIKYERPFVKRFISSIYDDEYYRIPLKVAGVIAQYVQDSI